MVVFFEHKLEIFVEDSEKHEFDGSDVLFDANDVFKVAWSVNGLHNVLHDFEAFLMLNVTLKYQILNLTLGLFGKGIQFGKLDDGRKCGNIAKNEDRCKMFLTSESDLGRMCLANVCIHECSQI